jgi:hypothetical protein
MTAIMSATPLSSIFHVIIAEMLQKRQNGPILLW